jgi:hypothetical protein
VPTDVATLSRRQLAFRSMLAGILLYSVVLGLFNDYTDILHTGTYSVTFAVAVVMQLLTYLTFALKNGVVARLRQRGGPQHKLAIAFRVWLIMFLSKFVFLGAIAVILQGYVQISGFVGLMLIIVIMTVAQRLLQLIDRNSPTERLDVAALVESLLHVEVIGDRDREVNLLISTRELDLVKPTVQRFEQHPVASSSAVA